MTRLYSFHLVTTSVPLTRFLSSSATSRHCGRLLCHKCSIKEIPIIKFDLNKPVRVCDICFDVLTLGGVS